MRHLMVDLETLATTPDAVIMSAGLVAFDDIEIYEKVYMEFDCKQQQDMGRIIDVNTLKWWLQQEEPMPIHGHISIHELLKSINNLGIDGTTWQRGNFDVPLIENVAKKIKAKVPWKFYNIRDHRSVIPIMNKANNHNALDDAVAQVKCIQESVYHLEQGVL